MSVPKAIELACIVVDIVIPAEPSKFAVPTTSPDKAIALAVVNVSAEPVTLPSKLATSVPTA